jgi:hypothetical protein
MQLRGLLHGGNAILASTLLCKNVFEGVSASVVASEAASAAAPCHFGIQVVKK